VGEVLDNKLRSTVFERASGSTTEGLGIAADHEFTVMNSDGLDGADESGRHSSRRRWTGVENGRLRASTTNH